MAVKRKISIRKILQVFLTLVMSTCCIIAIVSASKIEDRKMLSSVAVHFKNDKKYHAVQEEEILNLALENKHIDIMHTPVSKLDIRSMEQRIMANPWVAFAQVYVDNERVLHMYVTQRIPVVRVFQQNGASFYLDTTLSIMPLSSSSIYYTTVVTNVPPLENDSACWALRKDLVTLSKTIQKDSFWNAQISEVIVDSPGMFEFVPVLGEHRILFGGVANSREKFHNLFVFYKNILNSIGWDKYQVLDVRFKDQVVASPSLPYTGPVDKDANKTNWINSVIAMEAAMDSVHATRQAKPKPVIGPRPAAARPPVKPVALAAKKKPNAQTGKAHTNDKKQRTPKYIYPGKKGH